MYCVPRASNGRSRVPSAVKLCWLRATTLTGSSAVTRTPRSLIVSDPVCSAVAGTVTEVNPPAGTEKAWLHPVPGMLAVPEVEVAEVIWSFRVWAP